MRLKGKTALISGAGRNNGKAIALTFAREGADVILVAREQGDSLNKVATQCEAFGAKVLPLLADVGKHEEVNRVVQRSLEQFKKVDVLVCAAALRPNHHLWEFSYEEWHRVFAVNVHSTFYFAKALAPIMMERKCGSIVTLGSVASLTPQIYMSLETACKHGLYGLTKAMALELGPYGIRANLIALAYIENDRLHSDWYQIKKATGEVINMHTDPDNLKAELARTPMGRKGTNQEVANVALFLASDESSYITGDRIVCAGGRYM